MLALLFVSCVKYVHFNIKQVFHSTESILKYKVIRLGKRHALVNPYHASNNVLNKLNVKFDYQSFSSICCDGFLSVGATWWLTCLGRRKGVEFIRVERNSRILIL